MKQDAYIRILRIYFLTSAILGILTLFTPFVWMEIGPLGKAYYGPTVPDIYIYGGVITGKDLNWLPILISMILQLVFILVGIFLAVLSFLYVGKNNKFALTCHAVCTLLLVCFPLWISFYTGHVINNSDGAAVDMTVHYGMGLYFYGVILLCNLFVYGVVIHARVKVARDQAQ